MISISGIFEAQQAAMTDMWTKASAGGRKWNKDGSRDLDKEDKNDSKNDKKNDKKNEKTAKKSEQSLSKIFKQLAIGIGPAMMMAEVMKGVIEPFEVILEPLALFGEIIGASLYPILQPLADAFYSLVPMVEQFAKAIGPVLTPIIDAIVPLVITFANTLGPLLIPFLAKLAPMVTDLAQQLGPVLTPLIEQLLPPIMSIVESLAIAFIPTLIALLPAITAVTPIIVGIANAFAWFVDLIKDVPAQIAGVLSDIIGAITGGIKNWYESL